MASRDLRSRSMGSKGFLATRHLYVFDDRQLVTELPRTIVCGAGEPGNSTVTQGTSDLYWFGPS
jgi:hypothetical protein